ncbi:MAG: bifunctional UDP-N-acetylglucosamine diphosphorylase/glucosamine-1-phosphate N-acetyltransferase GlmU [Rhodospirillales bacterium]|nr:bifunctional UDP-N-acetylglucosamine diphosphorylase/glucosamine-1-phosphate N-acetyltransferase GlmU [Rhodospirillales bacterium]
MTAQKSAAIVLAAGLGTRMKSALPKVLHPVAGRAMVLHLLDRLDELSFDRKIVVTGRDAQAVTRAVAPVPTAIQDPPLGTAHAVLAARDEMAGFDGDVLILFGDTPLMTRNTLETMLDARRGPGNPAIVVLGFRPDDPGQYGRLVTGSDGALEAIVEWRDASPDQRNIPVCNAGIMAVDGKHLFELLDAVGNNNAKEEYYLTDIVAIARARGLTCAVTEVADEREVMGVNARAELAIAEAVMQERLRDAAMANGATLTDPATVYFNFDTVLGSDVTVGPNVVFGPGVTVGNNVEIRAFCHVEGADISDGAIIGPFARLRPGARIGIDAHIGNFVEIKAALIETGAKINHLSYVGDARVGAGANVGAGTITCNYDGFFKSHTDIGAGAFIGSNTALVAPVSVGDGAITGAGSVITTDVPADALAVERNEQKNIERWAAEYRSRKSAEKNKKKG